jgi:hypothetical protein
VRRRAARWLERTGPRLVSGLRPSNKSLVLTAQAGFNGDGCLVGVGLVSEVGVKSSCVRWRGGVSCSASLLIVALYVPQHNSSVGQMRK